MHDDVLCAGVETTSTPTLMMLINWADFVLICGDESLLPWFTGVVSIHLNIGVDKWQQPMHPDLVRDVLTALENDTNLLTETRWDKQTYLMLNDQAYLSRRGTFANETDA